MNEFSIRCRAIIIHEGKLLVVRHRKGDSHTVLPGGHLEFGEDPVTCVQREILEELGVKPVVGQLLYVNTFVHHDGKQSTEFFFEVLNGADYGTIGDNERSHGFEINEWMWISPADNANLLPRKCATDFKNGALPNGEVRFITDFAK